ncbi:MAG TPA: WbqC family protein [Candidatus Sumerlaeota bacterium]|nr:WbqC family protein [Candidatus Sumerlaeota bacterium]
MILGIMQPYFFPYLGYFDLINYSDQWIVFDTPQFIRHGWINRNRILHPNQGWQYVMVPLGKHSQKAAICEVLISSSCDWRERIAGQLQHYRGHAPFFSQTMGLLEECFRIETDSISRLDIHILSTVCRFLGIHFQPQLFSEMNLPLGPIQSPGDWALRISSALGASEYVNPPGGEVLFDHHQFQEMGIRLAIRRFPTFVYPCRGYSFEPNLSILDVLMWNQAGDVKTFLDNQKASTMTNQSKNALGENNGA